MKRSFDVSFDLRLNKRFSKQSRRRWFETLSRPLWRHCNAIPPMRSRGISRVDISCQRKLRSITALLLQTFQILFGDIKETRNTREMRHTKCWFQVTKCNKTPSCNYLYDDVARNSFVSIGRCLGMPLHAMAFILIQRTKFYLSPSDACIRR